MYWNVTQLYFFMLTTAFGFVCFFFHSPQLCTSHPRPKWYVIVGCVYLFRFLNGFSSTSCPSLYTKRLRRPERLCIVYFDPPSALNKPTAPLQALLEHGHLMNQRLYVQRPSVLTPLLRFERSSPHAEGGESHSRTSQPSHQKHHRSKLMLTVCETISYGNEYFSSFMVSFSVREECRSLAQ